MLSTQGIYISSKTESIFKGCDSNFEVNICQKLKVATNETSIKARY